MVNITKYSVFLGVVFLLWSTPAFCELTVGIIPFKNYTGDSSLDTMGQGIAQAISREISHIKGLHLVSDKDVKDILQEGVLQEALSAEAGKTVKGIRIPSIGVLVIGGVYKEGDAIILRARLVDTGSGAVFAAVESRGNKKREKTMIEGLARGIRERLETRETPSLAEERAPALPTNVVQVEGSGTSPSERAALILAKRNAVEKAVGSKLVLKNIPNQREVLSRAESTLSYETVSQKKEGKNYTIVIKAQVTIPPDLLARYGIEATPLTTGYKALRTQTPHGEVNWEEGYVIARGRGKGKGPEEARRAALVEARARDSEKTVKGFVSKEEKLAYELKGFIEKSEVLEEKEISEKEFEVSLKVPLVGIKGLTVLFMDAFVPEKKVEEEARVKEAAVVPESAPEETTGVVIDARGTGLRPSLFPKVSDDKGKVVHSPGQASRASIEKMGMASFVTGGKKKVDESLPKREGRKPLIIKAKGAEGAMKANLILSSEDAEKLAKADAGSGILKGSKVVIITDTPVGGTEG